MQSGKSLPSYLRGGTPGALIVFKFGEAVMSILAGIIMVVTLFRSPSDSSIISSLFSLSASAFGMVLVILEGISALKLRRGSGWDATRIRTIWSIRRVATIILMIILGITCTILMFSQGGFLMGFIMLALYEGFMCFMLCYTNDVRTNMSIVSEELYSGKPTFYLPDNRLSGLAIFFGVLMGVCTLVMCFALNSYRSYSYSLYDVIYNYGMLIPFVLFLTAAHFFLVAGCNRAFKRAHAVRVDATDFAPTGMNRATTLGVIGAILFSWLALSQLSSLFSLLDYRYYSSIQIVNILGYLSVYFLFAVALLVFRARDLLTSIGAGLILILNGYFLTTGMSSATSIWDVAYTVTYLSAMALLLVMAVLGLARRPVPFAMRIIAIALFAYTPLYAILYSIIHRSFFLYVFRSILTGTVPITVGFVALSLAVGRPAAPTEERDPGEMSDGDGAPPSVG